MPCDRTYWTSLEEPVREANINNPKWNLSEYVGTCIVHMYPDTYAAKLTAALGSGLDSNYTLTSPVDNITFPKLLHKYSGQS